MSKKKEDKRQSTLAALLEDKPKRGRPPRKVSRQNVYVALSSKQKALMKQLARSLPPGIVRSDIPDLSVTILSVRLEALRRAVAGRNREIPEGITDMESLYLLWDLPLPDYETVDKWTSVRLSPQPAIELGRVHGMLNAIFGVTRSDTFSLGLALLDYFVGQNLSSLQKANWDVESMRDYITRVYL